MKNVKPKKWQKFRNLGFKGIPLRKINFFYEIFDWSNKIKQIIAASFFIGQRQMKFKILLSIPAS
jgi:hypothetical protein